MITPGSNERERQIGLNNKRMLVAGLISAGTLVVLGIILMVLFS